MASEPIPTVIKVDFSKPFNKQDKPHFHNRYHPDIPAAVTVKQGQVFKVECFDAFGDQIRNDDNAIDLTTSDLNVAHVMSGPIGVEGAEPGDALEVEILDVQPLPGREWGFTGLMGPAGGLLHDVFPNPKKAIWDFEGIYAKSRHIPGVRFAGLIHPGVVATAPTKELMEEWNNREMELFNTNPTRVPAFGFPPLAAGALIGALEGTPQADKVKKEAIRTVPPREHGGNCDIKNLSRGSKLWLPVYVPGANLSVGDIHFSEGDGEIAFCGAIEMSGVLTLKVRVIKQGIKHFAMKTPIFLPGPVEPRYARYLTFEGISVDSEGKQHFVDATVSFKQAVLNCIEYFKKFGYTGEQVAMLLSACPTEGRIASIVDVPNALCTIGVPVDIFDFDVLPKDGGFTPMNRGDAAPVIPEK